MRNTLKKAAAGTIMGGALLVTAGAGMATAEPLNLQDGLVNVAVGDVAILNDVNVGVAAQVVATICNIPVTAAVLGEVDQSGTAFTPECTTPGGDVTVTQNAGTPGQSGGAGNSENSNAGGNANRPAR